MPERPTCGTARGQNAGYGGVYMPGLNQHRGSRWVYVFWKAESSGSFAGYKKETECIVFLGWTLLTKTVNWEERHAFSRRTASYTFDGLRARGFLFIQLEELWAGTIRGEIEARGMNLRQLQEIDQEVWTESPEINSREKKREGEETPERSRTF